MDILKNFNEVKIDSPVDIIIKQIRKLITSGQLAPGDRLPPERKLAERLGVSRSQLRDAIRKLEFYGILKTLPQSGTFVSGMGIVALEGLLTDVLKLERSDFTSLVETRVILEINAAKLAAERRTEMDIVEIQKALDTYEGKIADNYQGVEEDLYFHFKIAEASKNMVMKSLMQVIIPDIVSSFIKLKVCDKGAKLKAFEDHKEIFQHIINQDSEAASEAMKNHLQDVLDYSRSQLF